MVLVYRRRSILFLKHLSLLVDLMCKGNKKYFALLLYRSLCAEWEKRAEGNVSVSVYGFAISCTKTRKSNYSETCIKRTVAEVPKFISLIYFK